MRLMLLVGMVPLLGGCFNESVILRHAQTGKTVKCGPYFAMTASSTMSAVERERGCIQDYQRQGYEPVME